MNPAQKTDAKANFRRKRAAPTVHINARRKKIQKKKTAIPNSKPWRTAKSAKNAKKIRKQFDALVFLSALRGLGGSMIFYGLKCHITWQKRCPNSESNFEFGIAEKKLVIDVSPSP